MLSAVVFPDPLGPMSPRISPGSTANERSSTAATPPKCFVRPCGAQQAHGLPPAASGAADSGFRRVASPHSPVRKKRAKTITVAAKTIIWMLPTLAQPLGGEVDEQRAHERAGERADAADHHHRDHEAGLQQQPELRAHQLAEGAVEGPGEPADRARQREGERLVAHHVDAAALRARSRRRGSRARSARRARA